MNGNTQQIRSVAEEMNNIEQIDCPVSGQLLKDYERYSSQTVNPEDLVALHVTDDYRNTILELDGLVGDLVDNRKDKILNDKTICILEVQ